MIPYYPLVQKERKYSLAFILKYVFTFQEFQQYEPIVSGMHRLKTVHYFPDQLNIYIEWEAIPSVNLYMKKISTLDLLQKEYTIHEIKPTSFKITHFALTDEKSDLFYHPDSLSHFLDTISLTPEEYHQLEFRMRSPHTLPDTFFSSIQELANKYRLFEKFLDDKK